MINNTYKELVNIVEEMKKEDIEILLNRTVNFLEKPEIIFYTKKENVIKGYLEIRNKHFYFEIRINKLANEKEYTITINIGKMLVVKKLEWVI
jgi:hypothetical protein